MKISIITATYNSGKTVGDTLKSVLAQTYHDYELLVVDGASKDNTLEVVKKMEPLFEGRMRYISEPDKGIYDAMNKGIRMATGDVIGILNSDDFYTSEMHWLASHGHWRTKRWMPCMATYTMWTMRT